MSLSSVLLSSPQTCSKALPFFLNQVCCHSRSEFCHPLDIILRQFISFLPAVLKSLEMAPLQNEAKRVFSSAEEQSERLPNGSCNLCRLWQGHCLKGVALPHSPARARDLFACVCTPKFRQFDRLGLPKIKSHILKHL